MRVLVTGSSGLVGSAFIQSLEGTDSEVFRLSSAQQGSLTWEGLKNGTCKLPERLDVVVNLAGETVLGRWTVAKKKRLHDSRVKTTRLLSLLLSEQEHPPKVFISASAVGFYGNRGGELLTEKSSSRDSLLAWVCKDWEKATEAAEQRGIRTVHMRIGNVLSKQGGMLKWTLPIFRLGLGGRLGSGDQYMSWIHIEDMIRIIHYVIQTESLNGVINVVSTHPVTNRDFTHILGEVLHRPTPFVVPASILRFIMGEAADEMLLSSQRVFPHVLLDHGFIFQWIDLKAALTDILAKSRSVITIGPRKL